VADKLVLPENKRDTLLEFIRLTLPQENNIASSYYKIKKDIEASSIKEFTLCKGSFYVYFIMFIKLALTRFKSFLNN